MLEYATGVINVKERDVFDHNDQERVINAPDREQAFKVLYDTDLAKNNIESKEIEKILESDTQNLKELISGLAKDENIWLFWFLFLKFDALNLKVALKNSDLPFKASIVPFETIKNRVADKRFKVENEYVESMIEEATGPDIEEAVDKAFLKTRLALAQKAGKLPLMIAEIEIDIANLKNMIKEKELFIEGGNLSKEELNILLGKGGGAFSQGLDKFLEGYSLSLILSEFQKDNDEVRLEKLLEVFLSEEILKKERDRGSGIDKIVSFFYRKINTQANIRLIFFAKESGISIQKLRSNLLPIQ